MLKTIKGKINLSNALFLLLILLVLSSAMSGEGGIENLYLLILIVLLQIYNIWAGLRAVKNQVQIQDVTSITYGLLLIWELLTTRLGLIDPFLFPYPETVLQLFVSNFPELLKGLLSSLFLLSSAFGLALTTSILLGLLVGWRRRLFYAVHPISKVLSAIPPIVYIPYAIAMLPTFKLASILVIFIGAFWPIFVSTLNATVQIDKHLIDSARMLHIKEKQLLFSIILPAIMPQVLTGCSVGLIFSFILLTSAEMIGATSGIGWYVKYYSDFGDYGKVIVGIIFIGMVVTVVMAIFELIQKRLLCWQEKVADK